MKTTVIFLLIFSMLAIAACTPYHHEGAATGAAIGGVTGAILDHRNPWRGGIIGAAIGAIAGATITDISMRASREAAMSGRPVEYRTEDGRGIYYAEPLEYDSYAKCRRIRERIWEDGRLVRDRVREVCEDTYERRYR